MTARLDGLGDLAARFDALLVDQFGVLIDGTGAYDGAPAALARLARSGKRIVVLSNSGKRAGPNAARLAALGFDPDSVVTVLSSGEVAHGLLRARLGRDLPARPRTLLLARDGDTSAVDGLDLPLTDDGAQADLVLLAASRGEEIGLDAYERLLAPAAARRVPCLCTNPDKTMLTARGPAFGAGRIADLYASLGGPVQRIGKPYRAIYDAALAALGDPDPARVVCIGDSPDHDVRGGRDAGLATALVRTGIHAGLADDALAALCRRSGAVPDFILPRFDFAPAAAPAEVQTER